jgi:hypothetical protein
MLEVLHSKARDASVKTFAHLHVDHIKSEVKHQSRHHNYIHCSSLYWMIYDIPISTIRS